MSVKNILDKIVDDAKLAESQILDKANAEAKKIKEANEVEVSKMLENNKTKANAEGEVKRDRLLQSAHLQVRNNKLKAKQELIQKVYKKSLEKLNELSDDEFVEFVKKTVSSMTIKEEGTMLLNSKRHGLVSSEVLKECNENLVLGEADDTIADGFVVKVGNVNYNFTFKAILESKQAELTSVITKELF